MKNISFKDRYVLEFHKPWAQEEVELALCLSMQVLKDNSILADIRIVSAVSLHDFITQCFPSIINSQRNMHYKNELFASLKLLYKEIYADFLTNHYTRANYDRELYNHQKRAISQMLHRKYNLLSFAPGLGKSIASATISKILKIKKTIIICPTIVKWNWFHDLTNKWGYDKLLWTILDRNKSKCIRAFNERFIVINYEMVVKHFDYITRDDVGHIIIDECQAIKNTKTNKNKGVSRLVKHFPEARVTLLSGTPMTNRVNDLFAYLKLTDHPLGKNYAKFIRSYAIRGGTKIIGAKNIDDLRVKMSNFMIRKKAEECLDLPDLTINKYYIDYEDVRGDYEELLNELYQNKKEYDNSNTRESKFEVKSKMNGNIHSLNRLLATGKVNKITHLIDKLLDNGRDVIVFSGYEDPLTALEKHYSDRCVKIDGSVGSYERSKRINKFTDDPSCNLFLGNFKAAGVGINLVNSRDVIFMNFPFTPDDLEQSYKRAHRIGQEQKVNVYYTICKDTIDEHIFNMVADKSDDINDILDKGKDGVVHYKKIPNMLINQLIKDHEIKKGIVTTNDKFQSVN